MTTGDFSALLRLTRLTNLVGFGEQGALLNSAELEMEGTLLESHLRKLPIRLSQGVKTAVCLRAEFREDPDWASNIDDYTDDGDRYLGTLQVSDHGGMPGPNGVDAWATISLLLPVGELPRLTAVQAKEWNLEILCDEIDEPTESQRGDHVVAFVKRIYLEPVLE